MFAAADFGADAVGFVFDPASPRCIDPGEASVLMAMLPPFVMAVGVFADPEAEAFADAEEACPTHLTQLGGREDEKDVRTCGPDVIKGIAYDPETIAAELERWSHCADVGAILLDGGGEWRGGSVGTAEGWATLRALVDACSKPVILGGLDVHSVGAAVRGVRPWGVDASGGLERDGHLNEDLIEAFCRAVREADHGQG